MRGEAAEGVGDTGDARSCFEGKISERDREEESMRGWMRSQCREESVHTVAEQNSQSLSNHSPGFRLCGFGEAAPARTGMRSF